MRGEHCVAGASVLSAIAVILLVFANIGQISPGAVTNGLYFAQVDVKAYGAGFQGATGTSAGGLYDTANDKMGMSMGLRQYYRYGIFKGCGYQTSGSGICNSTMFGYPMEPLSQMLADTPAKFKIQTDAIIPDSTFKNDTFNHNMTRAGSLLIFVGSCLSLLALIFGVMKARILFLVAASCAGSSALLLMLGSALWTAVVAKDAWLKIVKVEHGDALGILVTAGGSLYLSWVAFALMTLAVIPYVVACCTFRSK